MAQSSAFVRNAFLTKLNQDAANLSNEQKLVCLSDLIDMYLDEEWYERGLAYPTTACYMEWSKRIGYHFVSYANTLLAGKRVR